MKLKMFTIVLSILIVSVILSAGQKRKYGKELIVKEKTSISDILANPEKYNGKKIQVEGAIVGVCEKRGCWINIAGKNDGEKLRFKVEDGVIVFPMDVKGKNVTAEGVLSVKKYSKAELIKSGEMEAKEHGKKFDPSTVTEPKVILQLNGEGAVISK